MTSNSRAKKSSFGYRFKSDMQRNWALYCMLIPVIIFYILFHYKPMYGALIAFKDYAPAVGFADSPWVGFKHFANFFQARDFTRLMRNTVLLSFYELIFGFPLPIILALMLNEVKNKMFKRTIQTVSYMPYFISIIVVCGMIVSFSLTNGLFNDIIVLFGGERTALLANPKNYRLIYVLSSLWQGTGWGSVIYVAALSGVDLQLYEAAEIDGAGKFKQLLYVTLPGIAPTIIVMFILRIGNMLSMGYEKTILLYNPAIYETADIIASYTYRFGIGESGGQWSYSTAVGLFNSVINLVLLLSANFISKKVSETSLW